MTRKLTRAQETADAWLEQVIEEIIEPDRVIIDPHHHLWHHEENPYLLEDLWADTGGGHNVIATVFVECAAEYGRAAPAALAPVGETRFVAGLAEASQKAGPGHAAINGIVGHANLLLGEDIDEVLEAHLEAAPELFKGIRHSGAFDASDAIRTSHSNPPSDLYERPETLAALKVLGQKGLSFDAWNYHPFIPRLTALIAKLPDTQFILDHFGGPIGIGPYEGRRGEIFEVWKQDIKALSGLPNVVMKLGGMAMPVNGWGWHGRERPVSSDEFVAAQGDWYAHVLDCFGAGRCMFESNFPVDRRSLSYPVLWNAFKKLANSCGASEAEKAALFAGTARRTYRL